MHQKLLTFFLWSIGGGILFLFLGLGVHIFAITETVIVNGGVAPQQKDYAISITSDHAGQTVPQGTIITYTVTYGGNSGSAYTTDTTLTVNYNDDTPDSVTHVTDYVVGSAGDAANGANPVIDPVARTITWNMNNFNSQETNDTVQFELITNSNYTLPNPVTITITADLSNTYVTMPVASTTTTYEFDASLTPTPTPLPTATPIPTNTPTPTLPVTPTPTPGPAGTSTQSNNAPTATPTAIPTATPTPPPAQKPLKGIFTVDVTNLQPTLAQVTIRTIQTDQLAITYGTNINSLTNAIHIPATGENTITLQPLQADTTYYMQIIALDKNGTTINKDIFSFHTPTKATVPSINPQSLEVTADGITINKNPYNLSGQAAASQKFILPTSTNYTINFSFLNAANIKTVQAIVKNQQTGSEVLLDQNTLYSLMSERSPSTYIGSMLAPAFPGNYDLIIRSTTTNGGIQEQRIASLTILEPLHVYDDDGITPLEDARSYIEFYDFTKHVYEPLQSLYPQLKNPFFTQSDGTIHFPFPAGKYRITVSAFGHEEKVVTFAVGLQPNQIFPQIKLHKDYFNIGYFIRFIKETITDFVTTLVAGATLISGRQSYFFLLALLILPITLSFLAFFARTHMNLHTLFHFMSRHVYTDAVYKIIVLNDEQKAVDNAAIYLINKEDLIVFQTQTNGLGMAFVRIPNIEDLSIRILKQGYESFETSLETIARNKQTITVHLTKQPLHHPSRLSNGLHLSKRLFGAIFEWLLVTSFIVEILFATQFGLMMTAPFLIMSLINVLFWISYLHARKHSERVEG